MGVQGRLLHAQRWWKKYAGCMKSIAMRAEASIGRCEEALRVCGCDNNNCNYSPGSFTASCCCFQVGMRCGQAVGRAHRPPRAKISA